MYCTKQDLIDRYGQEELERYAWDHDNDQADDDRINRALADATELVDMYIGAVVALPLEGDAPPILVALTSDIARYRLQDDNPLEAAKERYEAAMSRLRDVAAGRASLQLETAKGTGAGPVYAQRAEADRTFTRETLEDY